MLRALRAFLALHHRGTIAAAADDVHLSPAAVSAQLKLLEESSALSSSYGQSARSSSRQRGIALSRSPKK
ncbi:LysR family transcriptional regulator [Bradyrhizobium sp. CSA112]|nr:LysR family transcriptional regulator [Bradyrhizobium sp. CSA112]